MSSAGGSTLYIVGSKTIKLAAIARAVFINKIIQSLYKKLKSMIKEEHKEEKS